MPQQAAQVHAGIARQGVAQITVFPARQRIHHQHLDLLHPHRHLKAALVVLRHRLVRLRRQLHGGGDLADLARRPENGILHFALGRDGDVLAGGFTEIVRDGDGRFDLARQVADDLEGDGNLLAQQPVGRGRNRVKHKAGHRRFPAHRHGEDRDVLLAVLRGRPQRGLARVPIAIAQEHDGLEVFVAVQRVLQRQAEIGAVDRVLIGRGRGKGFDGDLGPAQPRPPELRAPLAAPAIPGG